MASGCIMGDCLVCEEIVWEDEFDIVYDGEKIVFVHPECKIKANGMLLRIKKLEEKISILEKHIEKLDALEAQLAEIEGRKPDG